MNLITTLNYLYICLVSSSRQLYWYWLDVFRGLGPRFPFTVMVIISFLDFTQYDIVSYLYVCFTWLFFFQQNIESNSLYTEIFVIIVLSFWTRIMFGTNPQTVPFNKCLNWNCVDYNTSFGKKAPILYKTSQYYHFLEIPNDALFFYLYIMIWNNIDRKSVV